MDGVLIDSAPAVRVAWSEWAQRRGIDPDEVMLIAHGRRTTEIIAALNPNSDPGPEAAAIERSINEKVTPASAIAPTCELYSSLDPARRAVATSALRATAEHNFPVLGIDPPRSLVTAEDVDAGKPAPDAYLQAAERLGVDPAACVVIEDAPAGIAAGRAAGARVVAVTTTHAAAELTDADAVVAPEDLLDERLRAKLLG